MGKIGFYAYLKGFRASSPFSTASSLVISSLLNFEEEDSSISLQSLK